MVKSNLKCQTLKRRGNIFENFLFGKTDHESTSLLGNNYYSVAYNNMINVKMFDKFMILDCFWEHTIWWHWLTFQSWDQRGSQ